MSWTWCLPTTPGNRPTALATSSCLPLVHERQFTSDHTVALEEKASGKESLPLRVLTAPGDERPATFRPSAASWPGVRSATARQIPTRRPQCERALARCLVQFLFAAA